MVIHIILSQEPVITLFEAIETSFLFALSTFLALRSAVSAEFESSLHQCIIHFIGLHL